MTSHASPPIVVNGLQLLVGVDTIAPHPRNPRDGDVGAIVESLQEHGFYGSIIVQRSTGFIIAGNHRWKAAVAAGMSEVPVQYLDVDDERALRILLVDNRSSDRASYDNAELLALLTELPDLHGTGYDSEDLDHLAALLQPSDYGTGGSTADDDDEAHKRDGDKITVRVKEPIATEACRKAIGELLAANPEWKADCST